MVGMCKEERPAQGGGWVSGKCFGGILGNRWSPLNLTKQLLRTTWQTTCGALKAHGIITVEPDPSNTKGINLSGEVVFCAVGHGETGNSGACSLVVRTRFQTAKCPGGICPVGPSRSLGWYCGRVEFRRLNRSWTSFVDDVQRCLGGSPETAEAGSGGYLANARFAALRA
jgi:hypothetical protein